MGWPHPPPLEGVQTGTFRQPRKLIFGMLPHFDPYPLTFEPFNGFWKFKKLNWSESNQDLKELNLRTRWQTVMWITAFVFIYKITNQEVRWIHSPKYITFLYSLPSFTFHPSNSTLHISSFTLHPSPIILQPSSFNLHASPYIL